MATTTTTKPYELTIIADALAEQSQIDELTKKIRKYGKITGGEDDGIKRLAYPIRNQDRGHFLFYTLELETDEPNKIAGILNIDSTVLRFLLVRCDSQYAKK
jgi:ribosomal protein S6